MARNPNADPRERTPYRSVTGVAENHRHADRGSAVTGRGRSPDRRPDGDYNHSCRRHPRNHTRRHILARCCSWRARLPGDSTWFPMESSGRTGADLLHGSPVMDHLRACRFRTVAGDSRTFRSGEWRRRRFGSAGERPGCRHHGHCRFLATAGDDHRRIAVTRRPLDAQPPDRRT